MDEKKIKRADPIVVGVMHMETSSGICQVTLYESEENPIFLASEIGACIPLKHPRDAIKWVPDDNRRILKLDGIDQNGLNKHGALTLISNSRKPTAKKVLDGFMTSFGPIISCFPIIEPKPIVTKSIEGIANKRPLRKYVQNAVWNSHFHEQFYGECICCRGVLSIQNFEVGHIIAKSKGGDNSIANLRPICGLCNKSTGTENMDNVVQSVWNHPSTS